MPAIRALLLVLALVAAAWAAAPVATAQDEGFSWPERRFAPCAAFDGQHGDLYVFGGRSEGAARHFGDAWRLGVRRAAPSWEPLPATGGPPPVRSCAATWDGDRMLVFGGWDGVTPTNGVWALTPGPAPAWERLCDATSCGTPPTARRAAQAIYDPAGDRMLVVRRARHPVPRRPLGAAARRRAGVAPDRQLRPRAARRALAELRRRAPARMALRREHERPRPRRHLEP